MALFDDLVSALLAREAGYVNDPNDRGGPTNFGITQAVARANGYAGDMRAMTRAQAVAIYQLVYWQRTGIAQVSAYAPDVAAELFDCAVNMGASVAGSFLQRALNIFNRGGRDYPDVPTDGQIGPMTIQALAGFVRVRGLDGLKVLLTTLKCLRGARYVALAEANLSAEDFVFGWIKNRVLNT